jgi:hypothetical protein
MKLSPVSSHLGCVDFDGSVESSDYILLVCSEEASQKIGSNVDV